jgi:hypothetical protein
MRAALALIVFSALLIGFAVWGGMNTVSGLEGGELTGHGWFALGLGVVFTALIGCGLFTLLFWSARNGHDDIVPPNDPPST